MIWYDKIRVLLRLPPPSLLFFTLTLCTWKKYPSQKVSSVEISIKQKQLFCTEGNPISFCCLNRCVDLVAVCKQIKAGWHEICVVLYRTIINTVLTFHHIESFGWWQLRGIGQYRSQCCLRYRECGLTHQKTKESRAAVSYFSIHMFMIWPDWCLEVENRFYKVGVYWSVL